MAEVETLDQPRLAHERIHSICSRAVDAVDRNPWAVLLFIAVIYFGITLSVSAFRVLWFDELITFYIARLNSVHAIWNALYKGADPNPALMHLLVMWSMRMFGSGQIALRLPAILIEGVGIFCLFEFLRKRVPVTYAASAVFFFIASRAFDYSYESRSYALTVGFAMLAVLLWRYAVESPHRMAATVGLGLTLAAGISSNYFAVLAFFPIAFGELVRNYENRRIDLRVWIALFLGGLPIFAYMPLINHAIASFAPHAWNKPDPAFLIDAYVSMIDVILYPALALLWAGVVIHIYQRVKELRIAPAVLPPHELAATIGLMAYPLIGYVIAVARAGMISPRFILPMCFGFAIAVAVTAFRIFGRNPVAALLMLAICFVWGLTRNGESISELVEQKESFNNILNHAPKSGTIVVSDSLLALPMVHYAPPDVARRIVMPLDFAFVQKYKHEDSPEQNLKNGEQIFPLRLVSLAELESENKSYSIVTTPDNWLLQYFFWETGTPATRVIGDIGGRHIGGFTPLCHGEPFLFQRRSQYALTNDPALQHQPRGSQHTTD